MREWIRDRGLLLANIALFLTFFGGMVVTGAASYSEDQVAHGQAAVSVGEYLSTGSFMEATFENWESEFLQMGMYVVLTAYLFQKGSSESKPVGKTAPQDQDPRTAPQRSQDAVAGSPRWLGSEDLRTLLVWTVFAALRGLRYSARIRGRRRLQ